MYSVGILHTEQIRSVNFLKSVMYFEFKTSNFNAVNRIGIIKIYILPNLRIEVYQKWDK